MMDKIHGKRILMFSPYGTCLHYTLGMKHELEKRGAEVRLYDERPSQKSLAKIYIYFFRKIAPQYFSNYIGKICLECKDFNPDIVFIVRGQAFDKKILEFLRSKFSEATFVFYQWDPLCGKKIPDILSQYDRAFSFDQDDVNNNPEFIFRPSIYLNEYADISINDKYQYDVSFVGTIYNNRWWVIKRFIDYFQSNCIKAYFYLYMPSWTVYLWDFIRRGDFVNPSIMQFKAMGFHENVSLVKKSKCVLDIVYSEQRGLSMRAFESMASHRKYITNNADVKNYDFYNPNNVLVVDSHNPVIPKDFINSPFEPIDDKVLYKYSIEGFVDEVFDGLL